MNALATIRFRPYFSLLAAAVAISLVCAALRVKLVYYEIATFDDARWIIKEAIKNSYYDMAVTWGVFGACLVLLALARKIGWSGKSVAFLYIVFGVVSTVLACINVLSVDYIGGSLTYAWIYYADLLRSVTAQSALEQAINASFYVMLAASLAGWLSAYSIIYLTLSRINRGFVGFVASVGLCIVLVGYFVHFRNPSDDERRNFTNPILELLATATAADPLSLLAGEAPLLEAPLPKPTYDTAILPSSLSSHTIRNVVLIVMESVGARFVAGTGPVEAGEWTPRIASYANATMAFTNIYAHAPLTTKSLYALETSRYPVFSFESDVATQQNARMETLSTVLEKSGFRTAFFMSSDFDFHYSGSFLKQRGFERLSDFRTIPCTMPKNVGSTNAWPHSDSVPDSCTAGSLIQWIDSGGSQPFLAVMWTNDTHWPYFPAQGQTDAKSPSYLETYLAALRSSDDAIGGIIDHLRNRGVLDNTLVVVMGDHGEAFREHGFLVHGNSIYEEETHIPLLFISGGIHEPVQNSTLGGIVDIAPTILHELGMKSDTTWEGRSLFDPFRSPRVFLFAPNQEMLAGYVEAGKKFIHNFARNTDFVYDLRSDPHETRNVANPPSTQELRRRLAGWLHMQAEQNAAIRHDR